MTESETPIADAVESAPVERELGVENVECANCGKKLAAVTQPDGTTAYESCSKCYKPATKTAVKHETAEFLEAATQREQGSVVEPAS